MKSVRSFGLATVALLGSALVNSAIAATVNPIAGSVLVNRGKGFNAVTGITTANPGDVVMARNNGAAEIVFEDGCVVKVESGNLVRIAEGPSPCAAAGSAAAASGAGNGGLSTATIVAGAAVVGGAVIGAVALSGSGDKKSPASP